MFYERHNLEEFFVMLCLFSTFYASCEIRNITFVRDGVLSFDGELLNHRESCLVPSFSFSAFTFSRLIMLHYLPKD